MVGDCGPMVMGCGSDNLMVVVLVLGPQCGVFNNLDFFFPTIVYGCKWILLVAGGWRQQWWVDVV